MSVCVANRPGAPNQPGSDWSADTQGVVILDPIVQEYLKDKRSLRTALAQWESALRMKFRGKPMRTQVELSRDPDTCELEVGLIVAVGMPGKEARMLLDQVIDEGLPPEAESHFDDVDVVLIGQ